MDRREGDQQRIRSASASADKLARARHAAALETYATKKYGKDWAARADRRDIEEEFNEWLDSRRA